MNPEDYAAIEFPADQAEELDQDELHTAASPIGIVQDVLDWYDKQIADYKNPLLITGVNPSSNPEEVMRAILVAQAVIKDYKAKRAEFEHLFAEHIARKDADAA